MLRMTCELFRIYLLGLQFLSVCKFSIKFVSKELPGHSLSGQS